LFDYLIFIVYKVIVIIFRFMPRFLMKHILNGLSFLIYTLNKKHKKIANINLDFAFHNSKTKNEKDKIIKGSYKSLIYNMYEFIDNQYATKEDIFKKSKIVNESYIIDAIKEKKLIIFVAAHYGAWEQSLPVVSLLHGKVNIVNRRMNNKYIHNEYKKARDKNNLVMIDKRSAAKGMIRALKKKEHVAVVIDQNTAYGVDIRFFSRKTRATDSTSRLAIKFDALIIPIICVMNEFGSYTILCKKPIDHNELEEENKIEVLTQIQTNVFEEQIRKVPEQWFWQHKRWKYHYPDMYK